MPQAKMAGGMPQGRTDDKGSVHWSAQSRLQRGQLEWLARPFLGWFDVTDYERFDRLGKGSKDPAYESGSSGYHRLALKPTPASEELISTNRELVCIYADFDTFDVRTVELLDRLHRDTRFDERLSFIVANDPKTDSIVREILSREPERFPIVAASAEEVRNGDPSRFRSLLYERMYTRDLFAVESPLLSDNLFFGRHQDLEHLTDRVASGQNSGIFGLRRIGKSSLLRAVERRCRAGMALARYWDLSFATYLPFQDLLGKLVKDLAAELALGKSFKRRLALNNGYTRQRAALDFAEDLMRLVAHPQVRGNRIVLLMDELEPVTFGGVSPSAHWDEDFVPFWQTVRSVHQESQGALTFIVAGVNPFALETPTVGGYDNPLFGTVSRTYVGPLGRESTGTMVNQIGQLMGVSVTQEVTDALYEEYGGHPFLIRQACSKLASQISRPGRVTTHVYDSHRSAVRVELKATAKRIVNILARWYPSEYELLRAVADGDMPIGDLDGSDAGSAAEHLFSYGLLVGGDEPRIRIGVIEDVLSHEQQTKELREGGAPNSDEEWLDLLATLNVRRNRVEVATRSLLRDGLLFRYGESKAFNAALGAVGGDRKSTLNSHSYDELFGPDCPLYWNELCEILDKNWDAFARRFKAEKRDVVGWYLFINEARRWDAHAKIPSEEEIAYANICFRRLEHELGVDRK